MTRPMCYSCGEDVEKSVSKSKRGWECLKCTKKNRFCNICDCFFIADHEDSSEVCNGCSEHSDNDD